MSSDQHPKSPLSYARCATSKKRRAPIIDIVPFTQPHVDASVPAFGGSVRFLSASGGLESVWIEVIDDDGNAVTHHPPVRLTPHNARCLAAGLVAYADSHSETEVDL